MFYREETADPFPVSLELALPKEANGQQLTASFTVWVETAGPFGSEPFESYLLSVHHSRTGGSDVYLQRDATALFQSKRLSLLVTLVKGLAKEAGALCRPAGTAGPWSDRVWVWSGSDSTTFRILTGTGQNFLFSLVSCVSLIRSQPGCGYLELSM